MAEIHVFSERTMRQLVRNQEQLRQIAARLERRQRAFVNELDDITAGGGAAAVAVAKEILPARVDYTPGGPILCTIHQSTSGADLAPGEQVDVYSWVRSDSPDPADQPNGELFIFISQDRDGTWWYHAIDCEDPPPAYTLLPDGSTIPSDGTEVVYVG